MGEKTKEKKKPTLNGGAKLVTSWIVIRSSCLEQNKYTLYLRRRTEKWVKSGSPLPYTDTCLCVGVVLKERKKKTEKKKSFFFFSF